MKILYIHQYFGTPRGSGGTRSYHFALALQSAGHEVTVACGSASRSTTDLEKPFVAGQREGIVDGIHIIEFDIGYTNADGLLARGRKFLRYALRASRLALFGKYDLVFASSTPLTAALPGIAAKVLRRRPFIFEVRDLWPEVPRAMGVQNPLWLWPMTLLAKAAYATADHVIVVAPRMVDSVAGWGVSPDRISVIQNGSDARLFESVEAVSPADLDPDRFQQGDFVAVFAGAHGRANGLDHVLMAADCMHKTGRDDIKILLIGEGSEKARLTMEAHKRGLSNVVFWSSMKKIELAKVLRASHAGLMTLSNIPTIYNGTSPNKCYDYFASGLPVITNYPDDLTDEILQTRSGWFAQPDNVRALAEVLIAAADDREGSAERGRNALQLARRKYDSALLARRCVAVVEGAVASASRELNSLSRSR